MILLLLHVARRTHYYCKASSVRTRCYYCTRRPFQKSRSCRKSHAVLRPRVVARPAKPYAATPPTSRLRRRRPRVGAPLTGCRFSAASPDTAFPTPPRPYSQTTNRPTPVTESYSRPTDTYARRTPQITRCARAVISAPPIVGYHVRNNIRVSQGRTSYAVAHLRLAPRIITGRRVITSFFPFASARFTRSGRSWRPARTRSSADHGVPPETDCPSSRMFDRQMVRFASVVLYILGFLYDMSIIVARLQSSRVHQMHATTQCRSRDCERNSGETRPTIPSKSRPDSSVGIGYVVADIYVVNASQARRRARVTAEEQLGEYGDGTTWLPPKRDSGIIPVCHCRQTQRGYDTGG